MADVAVEDDVIETEERALIHSIIEFGDTVVREVMVPRTDMVTIGADETVEAALERGAGGRASAGCRCVEQQIDDVVGRRLHQGPDPGRAEPDTGATRSATTCGRPTSCPRPSGWPT